MMIIKGYVTKRDIEGRTHFVGDTIDIPEDLLRQLIREEIKLDKIGMTRLPDTPEERSCETCKHVVGETAEEPCRTCITNTLPPMNQWEPKPQAPADALARARRLSECSVKDEVIAYYESAIAEEQARTKLQREIGASRLEENRDLRRRLEASESRYGVAEADRNREIERREEVERKLAKAWTEDDVGVAMWHCWDILQGQDVMDYAGFISKVNDWLASRRKERKG
jgi:hypothetical protein